LRRHVDGSSNEAEGEDEPSEGKRRVRSILRRGNTDSLAENDKAKAQQGDEIAAASSPDILLPPVIDPDKARFPGYLLPPLDLLDQLPASHGKNSGNDNTLVAAMLVQTLDEFGIEAEVTSIKQGPVVTRYELLPARGVRVERIAALANNLALSLKAHSLRVQAPVPGKGVVGIEVPNDIAKIVVMREVIESSEWNTGAVRLPLALGKDVGGRNVVADLAKMPHLLVAGATGSGKSVCINAILSGLFLSKTPDELRGHLWSELRGNSAISVYRRNLQRAYVERMEYLMTQELPSISAQARRFMGMTSVNVSQSDIRPIVREQLEILKRDLSRNNSRDRATRIHLADLERRIDNILNPD